jgi:hypothetical protein
MDNARTPHDKIEELKHEQWLYGIVLALLFMNLLDALLTSVWLSSGIATESNPLMAELIGWGWAPFAAGKVALVSLGAYLLWRRRSHPLAVVGIFVSFVVYYAVLVQHVSGFTDHVLMGGSILSPEFIQREVEPTWALMPGPLTRI